jgi:hypothetical protein
VNRLNTAKRVQVVAALVEGNSINSIVRMTGVAKHTILNLLCDLGVACADYHDANVRNLKVRRLQCEEEERHARAKGRRLGRRVDVDRAGC